MEAGSWGATNKSRQPFFLLVDRFEHHELVYLIGLGLSDVPNIDKRVFRPVNKDVRVFRGPLQTCQSSGTRETVPT